MESTANDPKKKKVTLICAGDTIEKVYPPLLLALKSAEAGAEVGIFFTMDGINMLKKGGLAKAKYFMHGILGWIPGMPWMATKMMLKFADQRANVPPPTEMLEMCQYEGVKLYACHMAMAMMGMGPDDLIDGTEVLTADDYVKLALKADVNMFI